MISKQKKWVHILIGLMDSATGLGLFFLPVWTMDWMYVDLNGASPQAITFLRFIGAFVFAVGLTYFSPFFQRCALNGSPGISDFLSVWKLTAIVRFCIGIAVITLITSGGLELPWAVIAVTDLSVSGLQVYWIKEAMQR